MDDGRWTMDGGRWTMEERNVLEDGRWNVVDNGRWVRNCAIGSLAGGLGFLLMDLIFGCKHGRCAQTNWNPIGAYPMIHFADRFDLHLAARSIPPSFIVHYSLFIIH